MTTDTSAELTTDTSAELTTNSADTGGVFDLAQLSELSDSDLLASTRKLVGRSNRLLAALLLHLGEVEARGLHRIRACSSLYTYCIYELRLSEDEAFRRVAAARLVQRFPALFNAVANGELHLTGLLLLGPHLTLENADQVLARARHRTKKEITRLVRELAPLPDVPARIEPLGPAPARLVPDSPSWEQWAVSLCPVRELTPGDRPGDWVDRANDVAAEAPDAPAVLSGLSTGLSEDPEVPPESPAPAPARVEAAAPMAAQRYRVEFTVSAEYLRLVEQAKALLSHAVPSGALEQIHLQAMRLLVAELEKRKYGVTARPRKHSPEASVTPPSPSPAAADSEALAREQEDGAPRNRGRTVPAAVRRAVFVRDSGRCSYVDARGARCHETYRLELHHIEAFARGGAHTEANLALRCASHNALAAEGDFGRDFMASKRDALEHQSAASVARGLHSHHGPGEGHRVLLIERH